jgi:hypothetical protein
MQSGNNSVQHLQHRASAAEAALLQLQTLLESQQLLYEQQQQQQQLQQQQISHSEAKIRELTELLANAQVLVFQDVSHS